MFAGLDFGTSGARICVINQHKSIQWQLQIPYESTHHQTPQIWRTALFKLLASIPKELASQLESILIDGTSGTVLMCDGALEPVSPALMYDDNRAVSQAAQLKRIAPHVPTICTPTSGLAKFLWLTQHHFPKQTAYFLHQADWLTSLLSGEPGISDYHNSLKTGYDTQTLSWPDWINELPLNNLLPSVKTPADIIGYVQKKISTTFGINPACLIHAGTTDSIAAFIAADVHAVGVGVTSLGTTLVLKQLSEKRIDVQAYGIYSHRYHDKWLVGGASNSGGGVLRQHFTDSKLNSLSTQINPLLDSPYDYYPLPKVGERFPINDPQMPPKIHPRPNNEVEFLHGMFQGLARIEAAGYAKLQEQGAPKIQHIVTNGGGSKNIVWQKLRERVIRMPISQALQTQAAYGSALACLDNLRKNPSK